MDRRPTISLAAALLCALAVAACGDDDEKGDAAVGGDAGAPEACSAKMGPEQACGGDLAGSWVYEEVCFDPDVVMGAIKVVCPTASGSNYQLLQAPGAALELTASEYTVAVKTDVAFDLQVPVECATTFGGCATVETMIRTGFAGNGIAGTVSCSESAGACVCAMAFTYDIAGSGTYTVADGVLTLSDGSEYYFCIVDGKLKVAAVAGKAEDEAAGYVLAPAP